MQMQQIQTSGVFEFRLCAAMISIDGKRSDNLKYSEIIERCIR